jgi:hypothetical protein
VVMGFYHCGPSVSNAMSSIFKVESIRSKQECDVDHQSMIFKENVFK